MAEPSRVVCGRCRGLNQTTAVVCAHCREPLAERSFKDDTVKEKMPNPGQRRCPGCGKWSTAQSAFCPDCGVRLPPRAARTDDGEAAGFWPRLIAFGIDCALLLVARELLLGRLQHRGFDWENLVDVRQLLPSLRNPDLTELLSYFALDAAYFTLAVGARGRTVGKRLLGLKITREDGTRVGFGLAFMRYLAHYFSLVPLGAGYFYIFANANRRALHDLLCQTRVIHADGGGAAPP